MWPDLALFLEEKYIGRSHTTYERRAQAADTVVQYGSDHCLRLSQGPRSFLVACGILTPRRDSRLATGV